MTQEPKITAALIYDFDGTLAPGNMQEYDFIPAVGQSNREFWNDANSLAEEQDADMTLTYMAKMLEAARSRKLSLRREAFQESGRNIRLFPGVKEWFGRINAFGRSQGVQVEHYVISSGLREIIEGSGIAREFREIYACEFFYDRDGLASWPKLDVNFTNKTQFVYRINKGVLDVSDDKSLNDSMPDDSKRVPFTNMIYIGDQYRSEIFYTSPEQRAVAERLIALLRSKGYRVATRVTPAGPFWPAETCHQDYYRRRGTPPYCHAYTRRF